MEQFKKPQLLKKPKANFCKDCGDIMELNHECDIDIIEQDVKIEPEVSKKRSIPEGIIPRIWMTDTRSHKIKPFILDYSDNNLNRKM